MAYQVDRQQPQLGLLPLLSVLAQPEGLQIEPQACLQGLQRVGAKFEDQASQTLDSRGAIGFNCATCNQSSLACVLYA